MLYRSPLPEIEIPAVPLTEFVLRHAADHPGKPALVDGPTGRTLTYGELTEAVHTLAGGLVAAGLRPGDVVALVAPNVPEYAVVFHAVAVAGGVVTPVNPAYPAVETARQLADSGAVLAIVAGPVAGPVLAAARSSAVRTVYLLGDAPEGASLDGGSREGTSLDGTSLDGGAASGVGPDVRPLGELLTASPVEQVDVDPESVLVLPYSSGTTGGTKGVMLSHRNLVANLAQLRAGSPLGPDDVVCGVLPFFHIYGMQVVMNGGLAEGTTVVTQPRFDLAQFLELHQRYGVTQSFVVPPIVLALAKHPAVDSYDLSALRRVFSGAAPLSGELALAAAERLGCEVVQGYGMTELSPVSHLTPPGQFRPGSVGVAAPGTQVRIVDPASGEDAEPGTPGEVWIRGPQVMLGYLGNPTATALTLDEEGWLRTGDIGHVDEDGHLYVVDRLKELIKVKGFQVPPAELEALLLSHPEVEDAAVIGVPDDEAGELPVAFVVRRPGPEDDDAAEAELRRYVAERVATYKRIQRYTFVTEVPKSASGKILRRVLRERVLAR